MPCLKEGKYVFVARVAAKEAPRGALTANMKSLLRKADLLKEEALACVR